MKALSFKPFWFAVAANVIMTAESLSWLRYPQGAHIRPMTEMMISVLTEFGLLVVFIWAAILMVMRKQWGIGLLTMGLCLAAFMISYFFGGWILETRQLVIAN
jgi:hypothetical protein